MDKDNIKSFLIVEFLAFIGMIIPIPIPFKIRVKK
jgi:uncharacterized membrane protein